MDTKLFHRKVVRNSVLEAIQGIGTAAVAGVLATSIHPEIGCATL